MVLKYFSVIGYASVVLWMLVPVLWVVHEKKRPRRWLCHIALGVAVLSYVLAVINSETYVNRIQIDRSEEIAEAQARVEKARQAAIDARGDDVAKVEFAEDDANDRMDEGGMDDADRKYMDSFDEELEPDWKKEKKQRSRTPKDDDSLEGILDTTEKEKGADTAEIEEEAAEPIMMPEKHMMAANRIDGLNLKLIRVLMLLGVGIVVADYFKRVNSYEEAYLPLPLPDEWANSMTPMPAVRHLPRKPRRTLKEELDWIIRRGDSYLYLVDDARTGKGVPEKGFRFPRFKLGTVDVIHVSDENPVVSEFVFESLWFGRGSFVVESDVHAWRIFDRMLELLEERKDSRAKVRETVHIIWDLSAPPPAEIVAEFERLGARTGFSLVLTHS